MLYFEKYYPFQFIVTPNPNLWFQLKMPTPYCLIATHTHTRKHTLLLGTWQQFNNLSNNKSSTGSFLKKSQTVFTSQNKVYFSWGGLLLNIPDIKADTRGWLSTIIFPSASWNADIADLWVPMVLFSNPFSHNSAKKFSTSFISDQVGDNYHLEQQPHHFFQADLQCLLLFVFIFLIIVLYI